MSKKNKTLLYAGIGVGAYLLLTSNSSNPLSSILPTQSTTSIPANTTQTTTAGVIAAYGTYLLQGAPAPPAAFPPGQWQQIDRTYFFTWELPAHIKVNPNVGVQSYTLTDTEAAQLMANFSDIATWANGDGKTALKVSSPYDACRYWWHTYGVSDRRTFLPMTPKFLGAYVPVVQPAKPATSGSGSWVSTALGIAGSVVALLGPNDPPLNAMDQQLLFTSAAVINEILPFYYKTNKKLAVPINDRLQSLLKQYA